MNAPLTEERPPGPDEANALIAGLSVHSLIDRRAEESSGDTFVIAPETGESLSYGALRAAVRALAGLVHARGIRKGDSVAFACTNGLDAVITILGLMYGGYRATAINLVAGVQTIAYVLENSETRLIVCTPDQRGLVDEALAMNEAQCEVITCPQPGAHHGSDGTLTGEAPQANDDGLLMYTSGTTGRPKGVILSHASLLSGGACATLAHALTPADRALCVLPLYHINGLCVTLMGTLLSGGSMVIPRKFSTSRFWHEIAAHRCTWFSVVPTQISYLLRDAENRPTPTPAWLRFGRSASAPLAPEVHRAFETRFGLPLIETMGLTETAAQILSNPLPPAERKIGSPGRAYGCEVRIVDPQMRDVPPGEEGEVVVRGPSVMTGYFRNPEATREALTAEGWLRTGDLGRQDNDGYVFITGRLKELIIKGGENIAPREIDDALYSHPAVVEAAAFARPCPDYGQRVEACVALNPAAQVSEDDLLAICRQRVGAFRAPDRIHFMDELPKGPSGKIQRRLLAEMTGG
jgi:acyl-CoA synthetase (AMP-forming)/AMP-acid ligase II